MAGCINYISLLVNCGYARVAMYEISKSMGNSTQPAATKFQALFPTFNPSDNYFQPSEHNPSRFAAQCGKISQVFAKGWYPPEAKQEYLSKFATTKWIKLSPEQKAKHSLSYCDGCREKNFNFSSFSLRSPYTIMTKFLPSTRKQQIP